MNKYRAVKIARDSLHLHIQQAEFLGGDPAGWNGELYEAYSELDSVLDLVYTGEE